MTAYIFYMFFSYIIQDYTSFFNKPKFKICNMLKIIAKISYLELLFIIIFVVIIRILLLIILIFIIPQIEDLLIIFVTTFISFVTYKLVNSKLFLYY